MVFLGFGVSLWIWVKNILGLSEKESERVFVELGGEERVRCFFSLLGSFIYLFLEDVFLSKRVFYLKCLYE